MSTSNLKFKRDVSIERSACEGIISLFTDDWDNTSKKSPRKITALVLMQIKDACVTVDCEKETKEHLMLLHANTYFEKMISLLQSKTALSMAITGKTYEDTIENLRKIELAAKGEEFQKDITSRLDFFIEQLNLMVAKMQSANRGRLIKCGIYSILAGLAITTLICYESWNVFGFSIDSAEIISFICTTGVAFVMLQNFLPE